MHITTFAMAPMAIFIISLVLFLVLSSLVWLYNFVFRQNATYPYNYDYNKYLNKIGITVPIDGLVFFAFIFSIVFVFATLILALLFGFRGPDAIIDTVWLLVIFVPLIPLFLRFIVDVCRSLKLNHKTGDSERIAKLEQELESLKSRSKPLL